MSNKCGWLNERWTVSLIGVLSLANTCTIFDPSKTGVERLTTFALNYKMPKDQWKVS